MQAITKNNSSGNYHLSILNYHLKKLDNKYHIFSPYRVCPLGAHVDHQHGLVTGFAIDKGVDLWFTPNESGQVHLESQTFERTVDFDVTHSSRLKENHWGDYARGVKYGFASVLL